MAIEPEMIKGVKKLLEDGFKEKGVEENLAKLGYSAKDAKNIISMAKLTMKKPDGEKAKGEKAEIKKKEPPVPEKEPLAKPPPADPELEAELVSFEEGPAITKLVPPPKIGRKKPVAQHKEKEPPSNAGKAMIIVLIVIVILIVLVVFVGLPKFGVNLV